MIFWIQTIFLAWFFLSLYLVYTDPELSKMLKIIGEIINIFTIGYIVSNMYHQNNTVLFFMTGVAILLWYLYYTPQDIRLALASSGTTLNWVYVVVDICTIIYLISTLSFASGYLFLDNISTKIHHLQYSVIPTIFGIC